MSCFSEKNVEIRVVREKDWTDSMNKLNEDVKGPGTIMELVDAMGLEMDQDTFAK